MATKCRETKKRKPTQHTFSINPFPFIIVGLFLIEGFVGFTMGFMISYNRTLTEGNIFTVDMNTMTDSTHEWEGVYIIGGEVNGNDI